MGRFHEDTAVVDVDGALTANVSRDWEIWGPNGGYVASIALRAAGLRAPEGHRPASFSCQYLSVGKFEAAQADVRTLKTGRSASCLAVELSQAGRVFLTAQVWTTNRDDGPEVATIETPAVPPPADVADISTLLGDTPRTHGFWQNFESRPVNWAREGSADLQGKPLQQWLRFKDFEPVDAFADAARSVVLIDTLLWPAHWRGQTDVDYIAPSLELSAWFHAPKPAGNWLLIDARSETAAGGLIHGMGKVWSEDGRLIASGGGNMLHTRMRPGR
jgi:acyl-CoA thioesterase-2